MIISKDNQGNWTPVATGNGTFVGTNAAFDAVKDDLPNNTVAYTTDDGTELCQYPAYTSLTTLYAKDKDDTTQSESWSMTETVTISSTGWYRIWAEVNNISAGKVTNRIVIKIGNCDTSAVGQTDSSGWSKDTDTIVAPIKKDTVVSIIYTLPAGMRGAVRVQKIN